jgi:hypothetical protein
MPAVAGPWHGQQAPLFHTLVDSLPGDTIQQGANLFDIVSAAGISQVRSGIFNAAQNGPSAGVWFVGAAADVSGIDERAVKLGQLNFLENLQSRYRVPTQLWQP